MKADERPLIWVGSSKKDLLELPTEVRRLIGHVLHFAQCGDQHDAAKVLKGFGDAGVVEVIASEANGTYRAVYTVRFAAAVFVLHCFQKKSTRGIATPQREIEIIRQRLQTAERIAKELSHG